MLYLFFKWLHIISVISWMAGILYLYRLFIYHQECGVDSSDNHKMLCVMERKLLGFIVNPAMIASWIAGIAMVMIMPGLLAGKWLHLKFVFVLALTGTTWFAGRIKKRLAAQQFTAIPSAKKLRFINEVPAVLMMIIVYFVVFKPF